MMIFLNDASRERKAEAPPSLFCRIPGTKHIVLFAKRNALPGIGHIDKDGMLKVLTNPILR